MTLILVQYTVNRINILTTKTNVLVDSYIYKEAVIIPHMVLPIPINLFFIIVYALVGNYTTYNTTSYYMPIINHMIAYVIDFDK